MGDIELAYFERQPESTSTDNRQSTFFINFDLFFICAVLYKF
jgi:hypothetical protein